MACQVPGRRACVCIDAIFDTQVERAASVRKVNQTGLQSRNGRVSLIQVRQYVAGQLQNFWINRSR